MLREGILIEILSLGMEDWTRHKSDKEVNSSECWRLRNGKLVKYTLNFDLVFC